MAAAAVVAVWASAAGAAGPATSMEGDIRGSYTEPKEWVEQGVTLPAYPDRSHLLNVPVQIPGSDLDMFIDENSLAIGEDGVVRYVLVLRSSSGVENVFFEGIRCTTHEFRRYAYGTSQSQWQSAETAWEPLRNLGVTRYRERLYQYYFCRPPMGTLSRHEMLQRIRYGAPRDVMN